MASILTVTAKGNNRKEVDKNLTTIDSYMTQQTIFTLVSSTKPNFNPRIYYSKETLDSKSIHDIITALKTDKDINSVVRGISYAGHLNNV